MILTHIYSITILGLTFRQATSDSKIVVPQTGAGNNELEILEVFARRGDPCVNVKLHKHFKSWDRSKADEECVRAVKGYAQLPRKARKRCGDPVIESSGCKVDSPSPLAMWYCGWLHPEDKRLVVSLSHCIKNSDLVCSQNWLNRSLQRPQSDFKIVVRQTVTDNNELESLRAFASRRDPCERVHMPLQSSDFLKPDEDCARAVKGYAQLPLEARKRCGDPVIESSGCKIDSPSPLKTWYCGWLQSEDRRSVVSLSYCIENLDLGSSKNWLERNLQRPQSTGRLQRGKSVAARLQFEEKETYLKLLKMFVEVDHINTGGSNDSVFMAVAGSDLNPCARLEGISDADAFLEADRLCKAAIDDFKSLPIEAKERCQNAAMHNEGCKREPHPSEKWCCGLDLHARRIGFGSFLLPKKTGTVCFSYCMRGLEKRVLS